ncbi:uncharacterized protein BXIN_1154 [Babesia sp. Xinjiang]|uniref:uncharacterized protein n=1 Tax=Babesia sp. Xinjiang TaxID=462227 RepID=UPI000A23C325|nr:uncharacterized protein BXIN_1154 [Babesia sp. Xinjiang]ORM40143.1 hypothetical protein BXIN_1154 [Babesia sp. Xinjiang]
MTGYAILLVKIWLTSNVVIVPVLGLQNSQPKCRNTKNGALYALKEATVTWRHSETRNGKPFENSRRRSCMPYSAFVPLGNRGICDKLVSRASKQNGSAECKATNDPGINGTSNFKDSLPLEHLFNRKQYDIGLPPDKVEDLRAMLDEVYLDGNGSDEDEAHPLSDVYLKYWSREPNDRDVLMRNLEMLMKEVDKVGDYAEACKNLGFPEPLTIKPELTSALLRDMFNLRAKPKSYTQYIAEALGLDKILGYFSGKEKQQRSSIWPFGIEIRDPNTEIQPLTETALRGYLGAPYYDHVAELAKRNPENARRILTVIHRIYTPPVLFIEMHPERAPTDHDLYMDSENVRKAQSEAYKKFVNTYPDLKWPVDDESFLDVYNTWYPDDKSMPLNSLQELMKEGYGSGANLKAPNFFYRFIALPTMSCAAGAAFGGLLATTINAAAGLVAGINLQGIIGTKMCSAAIALSTWFGMSRDMTVKGDIFDVALKNLVDNALENPKMLQQAAYSGLIPKDDVISGVERFVIHCTLAAFGRAMRLAKEGKGIETWNHLARQVGRVAEVCLPICGVSVYRIVYFAACDLASSDDLPCTDGGEVLGTDISGDPEYEDDDYSELYKKQHEELGIPPPDTHRPRYERNALLFTTFCLQAFGNLKNFKRTSDEEIDKYKEFLREIKMLNVSEDAWDNLKDQPMMPSTLDNVEKFSKELEQTGGKLKRITLEREYGFDPVNGIMGETEKQKHHRMQIELQEARDAVAGVTTPIGYKLEMLKAMAMTMYLREEWLLPKFREFLKQQCIEFLGAEIENMNANIDELIQGFQIRKEQNDMTKYAAMIHLARDLDKRNALDHDKILEMARVAGIPEDLALDACSVALFPKLMEELSTWDLESVTAETIADVKNRYRCKDLVFINALCEVIKKMAAGSKKEMLNARKKYNWNLVEKHLGDLLRSKTAIINAAASTIDCKLWYRIERAFRFNIPFLEHVFDDDEIVGRGRLERIENHDWELQDPPPKKSDYEIAEEEFNAELENKEPIPLSGEDNTTPLPLQMRLSNLVEKGEMDPEFECIPNEFHFGDPPKEIEYELDLELPPDKYELQRPILNSRNAYACWVVYCYRKRAVKEEDVKTVLTIFPFLEKLVERSDMHWRRLYARQRLRQKDSLGSTVDWCRELDCDEETALKVCSVAYEEDLLKRTGAFVGQIEDDIGDVGDSYFNPFDPSIYNRLNYLYSEKVPSELERENIKKLQQFFNLTPDVISDIHTKCFSHALDLHFGRLIRESSRDWPMTIRDELLPLAKELYIQEKPLDMLLRKAEHDYLKVEANELMINRTPGKDFLERCEFIIDEFKRLNVFYKEDGQHRQKFSIGAQNKHVMEKIIGAFIISCCDVYGKVDRQKLDEQCAVYGLFNDERKDVLNRLGRKFYYRFLKKFSEEELSMEAFNEVAHLHEVYEFEPKDVEEIYNKHVGIRIREWYDPASGLEALKRTITVVGNDSINRYIPFERSRRIHWFVNIINDCINIGDDKTNTRIFTYPPDDFFALQFEGGEENLDTLQGVVNVAIRVLELSPEEIYEARIVIAEEIGAAALKNALQCLKMKDGIYAADSDMSKFVRALSVAPPGTIATVKKELPPIKDYNQLRKVIMMLPCSDETLARSIKLLDEVEKA